MTQLLIKYANIVLTTTITAFLQFQEFCQRNQTVDSSVEEYFRRAAFSDQLKNKVGLALAKAAALRITINLDGAPIISKSHTHPSHSQTSRLLTSSLSSGIPRGTQCM
jgi:hypothetical protein